MTDRGAALVTGASRGIGAAVAERLASLGWPVMMLGRDPEALAASAKACAEHGNPVQWLAGDLADDGFMREAVARTETEWGTVDVLVNNAGIAVMQPVQKADLAAWRHLMKINYDCAVFLANAVLPSMLERETGAIINGFNNGTVLCPLDQLYIGISRNRSYGSIFLNITIDCGHNIRTACKRKKYISSGMDL